MASLRIPAALRSYTGHQALVHVHGTDVRAALVDLLQQYPLLGPHLFRDSNELRPPVNLFLGEANVRDLRGMDTSLADDALLILVPSIAGG